MKLETKFDPAKGELLVLPGNTVIPVDAFKNRDDITSATLPEGLEEIQSNAFAYCLKLRSVNLPTSLLTIGKEAFFANFELEELHIPENVVSIGDYAFQYNRNLQSVTIGNSVTTIGKRAFSNSWILNDLTLGDSITSIGEKAFYGSPKLSYLKIPDSVTRIEDDAFVGTGIKMVTLPKHFEDNPPTQAFEPGTTFNYQNQSEHTFGNLDNNGWQFGLFSGTWSDGDDQLEIARETVDISWKIGVNQKVNTMNGNDLLVLGGMTQPALINSGNLRMERGNDQLSLSVDENPVALHNMGMINMGKGKDRIDLITGMITGDGKIKMGANNDFFHGFGDQKIISGGKGIDQLILPDGSYNISRRGKKIHLTDGSYTTKVFGFEYIGGLEDNASDLISVDGIEDLNNLIIDEFKIANADNL